MKSKLYIDTNSASGNFIAKSEKPNHPHYFEVIPAERVAKANELAKQIVALDNITDYMKLDAIMRLLKELGEV